MNEPLSDPTEDAAAWERLRHRERVERASRRTNALRLSWFIMPAAVVVLWAVWFLGQLRAAPHAATVCWNLACLHFSAGDWSAYLATASMLYFVLAGALTALGAGLFFGKHPPFPVRFGGRERVVGK